MSFYTVLHRLVRPFFYSLLLWYLSADLATASGEANLSEPKLIPICTSFDPRTSSFGMIGPKSHDDIVTTCPKGYAYFALRNGSGPRRPGSKVPLVGTCCPLPPDALTESHVDAIEQCPAEHVVTGSVQVPQTGEALGEISKENKEIYWNNIRTQKLRCTKINDKRYSLSRPKGGWNVGWYGHFRTMFHRRTTRAQIPVALRYGLGRVNSTGFLHHFCVGQPWGSLVVGRTSKYCENTFFSELQYRHSSKEPATTAVFDASSCLALKSPLSASPICIKPDSSQRKAIKH